MVLKSTAVALMSLSLAATPVMAQASTAHSAAASASAKVSLDKVRASARTSEAQEVRGSGWLVALLALLAVGGGIAAATSGKKAPTSP